MILASVAVIMTTSTHPWAVAKAKTVDATSSTVRRTSSLWWPPPSVLTLAVVSVLMRPVPHAAADADGDAYDGDGGAVAEVETTEVAHDDADDG